MYMKYIEKPKIIITSINIFSDKNYHHRRWTLRRIKHNKQLTQWNLRGGDQCIILIFGDFYFLTLQILWVYIMISSFVFLWDFYVGKHMCLRDYMSFLFGFVFVWGDLSFSFVCLFVFFLFWPVYIYFIFF